MRGATAEPLFDSHLWDGTYSFGPDNLLPSMMLRSTVQILHLVKVSVPAVEAIFERGGIYH